MKKYLLFLLFSLGIISNVFCAPSNSMSISPSATDATTITASDENTRNNEVSTKFNAHDHNDIDQTANTLNVGDAAAGNKTITAYNADTNKPAIRYNDTSNIWTISDDGSTFSTRNLVSGIVTIEDVQTMLADKTVSGTVTVTNLYVTTGTFKTGTTNRGDILYDNGTSIVRLTPGTSGYFLKTQGASANPTWDAATGSYIVGSFTRDVSLATGTQAVTGVGFTPKAIYFIAGVENTTTGISWGYTSGTASAQNVSMAYAVNSYTFDESLKCIWHYPSAGNLCDGTLSSFDSDGFTISWTKTGSPTGTLNIFYLAFK